MQWKFRLNRAMRLSLFLVASGLMAWSMWNYDWRPNLLVFLAAVLVELVVTQEMEERMEDRAIELAKGATRADKDAFLRELDKRELIHVNRVEALSFEKGALAQQLEQRSDRRIRARVQRRVGGRFAPEDDNVVMTHQPIILDGTVNPTD